MQFVLIGQLSKFNYSPCFAPSPSESLVSRMMEKVADVATDCFKTCDLDENCMFKNIIYHNFQIQVMVWNI